MVHQEESTSEIATFYANKNIFITGGTGFLGKVLIEKLLRSCPDIGTVYFLVRHKKGKTPQQRINELLDSQLFDLVRKVNPDFGRKLEAIEGDLDLPGMGMSAEDEQKLAEHVNVVFHSAATVRFDEPIKVAIKMNIVGTKKVLELCKKLARLESFVHVSTAYANCNRSRINEEVYAPSVEPENMIQFAEWVSDDMAEKITPTLIGAWPNTYTYTKAIAESLVVKECESGQIPCAIVRPAIVGASYQEPMAGWIDNYNGATVIMVACGKGFKRCVYGNNEANADVIPVDYTVNMMIAAGWSAGVKKQPGIPVYNNTMAQLNKLNWRGYVEHCIAAYKKHPFDAPVFKPRPSFSSNRSLVQIRNCTEETMPAYLVDTYLRVTKKKPMFVRIQQKISKAMKTFEYFSTNSWEYSCDNILNLNDQMNETDKKLFTIDVRTIDWKTYIERYCLGIKKFLLKEEEKPNKTYSSVAKTNPMKNVGLAMLSFILITLVCFTLLSYLVFES